MGDKEMEITEECFVEGFKETMGGGDPRTRKKGGNKVKINEQDRELFELLLFQKFLDLQLIVKRFDPGEFPIKKGKTPRIYHRLYRLVKEGFLRNVKAKQSLLYLLNERGLREIRGKINLPLVTLSEVSAVDHDLACSNVRFYLEGIGGSGWVSERQFRVHSGEVARLPDGVFKLSDRIIFVEVEFSQKSNVRYMEIFRIYSRQGGPGRVVYFYRKRSDLDFLIALTKTNPRFGFFPYSKSLPPPEDLIGESQLKVMNLTQFLAT